MKDIFGYLRQVREELTKVTWPSRKEVIRLTLIVIVSSTIVGVYLAGLDYAFTQFLGLIIG
ncbi:preprotein translocase subunit SecE [Patescibacteria group bacterium]